MRDLPQQTNDERPVACNDERAKPEKHEAPVDHWPEVSGGRAEHRGASTPLARLLVASQAVAADCDRLQPRGSIKAPSLVANGGDIGGGALAEIGRASCRERV